MKYVLSAVALILAAPAAAQTAPAQHQDHQQHQQHQASQAGHAQHAQHSQHQAGQQGQHQGHAMADGCCADRNGNGRMDCCENMAQARGEDCCAGHDEHQATPAQPSPQSD